MSDLIFAVRLQSEYQSYCNRIGVKKLSRRWWWNNPARDIEEFGSAY